MHKIYFYQDSNGNKPVLDYLRELAGKKDKDSRIKFNKMNDYIQMLSQYGIQAGEPYIKHLDGSNQSLSICHYLEMLIEQKYLREKILYH